MLKMFKKTISVASIFATAACSSGIKEKLGLHNNAPDEFKVVSNAPLTLPPDFTLRPPMPGAKRPQEVDLGQQAKDTLFESQHKNSSASSSKGEDAFLKRANVSAADPEIKDTLKQDEQNVRAQEEAKKKRGFFAKIAAFFGFGSDDAAKQKSLDAQKEQEKNIDNKKEIKQEKENTTDAQKNVKGGLLNNVFGF